MICQDAGQAKLTAVPAATNVLKRIILMTIPTIKNRKNFERLTGTPTRSLSIFS